MPENILWPTIHTILISLIKQKYTWANEYLLSWLNFGILDRELAVGILKVVAADVLGNEAEAAASNTAIALE